MHTTPERPVAAPNNDLAVVLELVQADVDPASTAEEIPLTDAGGVVVRCYLSAYKGSATATPLSAGLDVEAVHKARGRWIVRFQRQQMTLALLAAAAAVNVAAIGAPIIYLIVDSAAGIFAHVVCDYVADLEAELVG
jgi:hypothetical protein